jgi:hypothetical protein
MNRIKEVLEAKGIKQLKMQSDDIFYKTDIADTIF